MKGGIVLFLAIPLLSCASFTPQPIEISEQKVYNADVLLCQTAANTYKPRIDYGNIGASTVTGATSNSSNAVINPLVPVVGAAGGLLGSLAAGFDLMGQAKRNVFKHCLLEKLRRDHSGIIADPDN